MKSRCDFNVGGRVKIEGRIYFSGRLAYMFPLAQDSPELEQVTDFDGAWECCPVWVTGK